MRSPLIERAVQFLLSPVRARARSLLLPSFVVGLSITLSDRESRKVDQIERYWKGREGKGVRQLRARTETGKKGTERERRKKIGQEVERGQGKNT